MPRRIGGVSSLATQSQGLCANCCTAAIALARAGTLGIIGLTNVPAGYAAAADKPCGSQAITPHYPSVGVGLRGSPYSLSLANAAQYRLNSASATESGPGRGATSVGNRAQRSYSVAVQHAAREYKVDAELIHAVITAESNYNPQALSPKGAYGLMQLMPETARRYGLTDMARPECNIRAGTAYLRDLLTLFDNDVKLALAAYNAGENAVIRYGKRIPPYQETQEYVPKVMEVYEQLKPVSSKSPGKAKRHYPIPLPQGRVEG